MSKRKPTKLRKMNLNSVDFVRQGANPDAHIMIKKSYDGEDDDVEKQPFFNGQFLPPPLYFIIARVFFIVNASV